MPKPNTASSLLARGLALEVLPPGLPLASRRPRRLITRSGSRVRGEHAVLDGAQLQWEAEVERDVLTIARACRNVTGVFSQPAVLVVEDGHYTPDTLVIKSERRIWLECKTEEELTQPGEKERLEQIARQFATWGEIFRIVTDADISSLGETVRNLRSLAQWRSVSVPEAVSRSLPPSARVRELEALVGLDHAWGAIADGWFIFDWAEPLTRNTELLRSSERVWYEPSFLRT